MRAYLRRAETGEPLKNPPILWEIESDPILAGCKIIAEAWDAVGLYQVGSFIGYRWAEWNGRYRDDVRSFWRGDPGMAGTLATRICGSWPGCAWKNTPTPRSPLGWGAASAPWNANSP